MEQVFFSKFFVCAVLIVILSFVNNRFLQMYKTQQTEDHTSPTFVLINSILSKYGNWVLLTFVLILYGFNPLIVTVLGELIGAFLGRLTCDKMTALFMKTKYLPFVIMFVCALIIIIK